MLSRPIENYWNWNKSYLLKLLCGEINLTIHLAICNRTPVQTPTELPYEKRAQDRNLRQMIFQS